MFWGTLLLLVYWKSSQTRWLWYQVDVVFFFLFQVQVLLSSFSWQHCFGYFQVSLGRCLQRYICNMLTFFFNERVLIHSFLNFVGFAWVLAFLFFFLFALAFFFLFLFCSVDFFFLFLLFLIFKQFLLFVALAVLVDEDFVDKTGWVGHQPRVFVILCFQVLCRLHLHRLEHARVQVLVESFDVHRQQLTETVVEQVRQTRVFEHRKLSQQQLSILRTFIVESDVKRRLAFAIFH